MHNDQIIIWLLGSCVSYWLLLTGNWLPRRLIRATEGGETRVISKSGNLCMWQRQGWETECQGNFYFFLIVLQCEQELWLHICLWPYMMCATNAQRPEEGTRPCGTGVTDSCEMPCGCKESNPGPLEREQALSHLSRPSKVDTSWWTGLVSWAMRTKQHTTINQKRGENVVNPPDTIIQC